MSGTTDDLPGFDASPFQVAVQASEATGQTGLSLAVKDGPRGVDLRELHSSLDSGRDFSSWAKAKLALFVEGEDFENLLPNVGEQVHGGHNRKDYAVSIDCAKQIAMLEQTARGRAVRLWFIEREKQLQTAEAGRSLTTPLSLRDSLVLNLELLDKNEALALENKAKDAEIAELAPKAEFYDAVVASDDVCQLATAGQVLGLPFGRNTLFQRLRNRGTLISGGARHNLPKQVYISQGLFTVKESTYLDDEKQPHIRFTTCVTQKGMDWLRKEFAEKKTKGAIA